MIYIYIYNEILNKLNINYRINSIFYEDNDLLVRYNNLPEDCKNIDILFINSIPCSSQYNYNIDEWNNIIIQLSKKYNIITTLKVNNIKCTTDYNLTLKEIASISTNIKYIVAINTGPLIGCLNIYAYKNIIKWFILCDNQYAFKFNNCINNMNINEIFNYLNK